MNQTRNISSAMGTVKRRGFSLLEVMIALAILTISVVILVETQSNAVLMTTAAENVITASDLASLKMTEARLRLEGEGFQVDDVYEKGDFSDLGDDALNIEFADLEMYNWEYSISEIDIGLAGDIAGAASTLDSSGVMGGDSSSGGGLAGMVGGDAGGGAGLGALGMGPDAVSEMLAPYIREIRVRVWWGKSSKWAEENGQDVTLVGHDVNPSGVIQLQQELPQ